VVISRSEGEISGEALQAALRRASALDHPAGLASNAD
jgi:hypothetical protein